MKVITAEEARRKANIRLGKVYGQIREASEREEVRLELDDGSLLEHNIAELKRQGYKVSNIPRKGKILISWS